MPPRVPVPTLTTERLLLRPFRQSDLDVYAAMGADPETIQYLGEGRPLGRAASWRLMAMLLGHWDLRGYGMWALEDRVTHEFVGRAGLYCEEEWPGVEIGWVVRRNRWGAGLATEAARAAARHAFAELDVDHLISLIHPDNAASIRVAEKLGARFERLTSLRGQACLVYRLERTGG